MGSILSGLPQVLLRPSLVPRARCVSVGGVGGLGVT